MSELYEDFVNRATPEAGRAASWAPYILQEVSRETIMEVVRRQYDPSASDAFIEGIANQIMKGLSNVVVWPKAVW